MDAWVRWYPLRLFPSLWERIDSLIQEGNIISSEEVLRELERKEDSLHGWAKERKAMFQPLSDQVQEAVNRVLAQFRAMVDDRSGKSFADPFVVATAMTTDTVLVTGEKPTGSARRPKIPDVCEHFGIPWMSMVELIEEEGWSF
jgi:hypothetical protein